MKVSEKIRSSGTPALPSPACSGVGSAERPGQNAPRGHVVRSLGRVSCPLFLSFREGSTNIISILGYRAASFFPVYNHRFRESSCQETSGDKVRESRTRISWSLAGGWWEGGLAGQSQGMQWSGCLSPEGGWGTVGKGSWVLMG